MQTNAQVCVGSLGDPVINQDFGSGFNPGQPLGSNITNYTFLPADCPGDGFYTIANRTDTCFGRTWHTLNHDHTGDKNGYMMLANASFEPGIFFVQTAYAGTLCPNTTYEFAAWILNLDTKSACGGASVRPNITFSIELNDGTILKTYNTGDIPTTDTATWIHYGTFFTSPANVTDVVVRMTNNAPGGCGNDIALDDITFRACGPVIQTGFNAPNGPTTQNICQGGSASYTLQAKVSASVSSYQWQSNTNNQGWADIPGKTDTSLNVVFTNATPGVYQYRLGVIAGSSSIVSCRVYSPPLTLNVNALPVVPPFSPQTFCEGDTLKLTASGGATYSWSGPNGLTSNQNPLLIPNVSMANAGTYSLIATSSSNCSAAAINIPVTIKPRVVASVSNAETVCAGTAVQLTASGGSFYKWTPATGLNQSNIANPVATPLITTTYRVSVSNGGCYDSTKSVTITVLQNPVANAGSNKQIAEGESIKLDGTIKGDEITGFYWSPGTYLDNPASLTPIATPTENITYTLTVTSQNCGVSTSSVNVRVYKKVFVSNTFTPNNDGINDTWEITNLITYPDAQLTVFNRYGQKVYQSTGYPKPWDGKENGEPLPVGTYYYIIDKKNDTPKIAGWVLIVR